MRDFLLFEQFCQRFEIGPDEGEVPPTKAFVQKLRYIATHAFVEMDKARKRIEQIETQQQQQQQSEKESLQAQQQKPSVPRGFADDD